MIDGLSGISNGIGLNVEVSLEHIGHSMEDF